MLQRRHRAWSALPALCVVVVAVAVAAEVAVAVTVVVAVAVRVAVVVPWLASSSEPTGKSTREAMHGLCHGNS